jgi:hypothetical protein
MQIIQELARVFGPWNSLYSNSSIVSTAVPALHIVTLVVSGGLAIAADRSTLRALREPVEARTRHLRELRAVHRPVLIWLTLLMISGTLLAAADVKTFATSIVFWVKMGIVGLLLLNGALLFRAERRLAQSIERGTAPSESNWKRLGTFARVSLSLWLLITVLGVVLTNAA